MKIDTDQTRTNVEVEAMAMAPIPTPYQRRPTSRRIRLVRRRDRAANAGAPFASARDAGQPVRGSTARGPPDLLEQLSLDWGHSQPPRRRQRREDRKATTPPGASQVITSGPSSVRPVEEALTAAELDAIVSAEPTEGAG
jgi:hypothetical protein